MSLKANTITETRVSRHLSNRLLSFFSHAIDSVARNPEFQRLIRLQTEAFARNTPYHSLELNDGTVIPGMISVEQLRTRLDRYPSARRSAR